jgi:hypothetical protein
MSARMASAEMVDVAWSAAGSSGEAMVGSGETIRRVALTTARA